MTARHEPPGDRPESALVSTTDLLDRFKQGDQEAFLLLVERSLPPLRRWARARLPAWTIDGPDTQDLVQEAILAALPSIKELTTSNAGTLQACLRQAVTNHIATRLRQTRPPSWYGSGSPDEHSPELSPLDRVIGRDAVKRYEDALQQMHPLDREAIIARVELQQSYDEVALALGEPNAESARARVTDAIRSLVIAMATKH